jgi:hypothetical protein
MTENIMRITAFCDDRKLGHVLRALAGLVIGTPEVVPVVNAQARNGALKQATNGSALDMFGAYLKKRKLSEVTRKVAAEFLKSVGRSPTSATYLLTQAKDAGLLRRRGKGSASKYTVQR